MSNMGFLWMFQAAMIACGLIAGVFLTFSDFVMRSLGRVDDAKGIEMMQVINREVYRWLFMSLFLGMAALSPLFISYAYLFLDGWIAIFTLAGSSIYLFGVFGVTVIVNVPMNNRLEKTEHGSATAATYWKTTYLPTWTRWNSVRGLASTIAGIFFLLAAMKSAVI